MGRGMGQRERAGVTVNNQFYEFTRHFLERKSAGEHLEASDELIIDVLSNPDHIQPPQGNRTPHWKKILELNTDDWWLVVVIADEITGPQVLSAYEANVRGERLWET